MKGSIWSYKLTFSDVSVDGDWLCLGSNAVRMFSASLSHFLFWGVIQGLVWEYLLFWMLSWYAKIKVVCDYINPVSLASVKDVSSCWGTFLFPHTPSDKNLWPYPLSNAVALALLGFKSPITYFPLLLILLNITLWAPYLHCCSNTCFQYKIGIMC